MKKILLLTAPIILTFALLICGYSAHATATSTLGSANAVPGNGICQSTTKNPIYGFDIVVSGTTPSPNLTGFNFTTSGTYVAGDVAKFQLWYSATNSFLSATQISTDITSTLGSGTHTFAAFSQTLAVTGTYYFWITMDASATAVYNHTITVAALTTANITVSTGAKAGTSNIGNAETMSTPAITIAPATVTRCAADAGSSLIASGATTYVWSPATALSTTNAASTSSIATSTITYTVTGTTSGCSSTASRLVTVNANPVIGVTNAGPVCNTAITASGASTYSWAPASGLSVTTGAIVTPIPTVTTTYTVTGTNAAGCTATNNTIISATPSVSITSGTVCASGTLSASATISGTTIAGYSWAPAAGLVTTTGGSVAATPLTLAIYTVTATASNGCTSNTTTTAGSPVVSVTPYAIDGCTGVAQPYTASGASTYHWAPSTYLSATTGATVNATPTASGNIIYTVTGTDSRGCTDTATAASGAGNISLMPWTEGFESVTNTVLCNELMGPALSSGSAQEGTGTATTVQAASGTTSGYGSAPVAIPARTGSGLAGFGFHANNDYFFTPGFSLAAGTTYEFSFWYRIDGGSTYTDDYNAYMVYNTTQSLTGATAFSSYTTAVTPGSNAALTSANTTSMTNATYKQSTGYFTPATSGTYYFGINAQNNNLTNTYYWGFDDVSFTQATTCASPLAASSVSCTPATGTYTNLSLTATADSFLCIAIPDGSGAPTAGPSNGIQYTVGSSLGGGTVIAKSGTAGTTTISGGYLAPGTNYDFYVYTYEHDSCNGIAYSTTYRTTASTPSFITCTNSAPATPILSSMLPGIAGTANITLSNLPTTGTVMVSAFTNAAATIPASPATYSVAAGASTLSISNSSVYTGANLWFTVSQTISGCTVTSSVSQEASVPFTLPWNQNFESGSVLNSMNPNSMQGNLGIYTDQTGAMYGGEDDHGATYITAHGGSWEYLFFGGVTTSTSAPGTGAPYIPLAVYTNQWMETPGLYCAAAGTYKLTFWYNSPSGAFPSIHIQYSNIPTLPSNSSSSMTSATEVATVVPTLGGGWHQYTVPLTITGTQTIFIGFDVAALSTSGYMAIDDIEVCEVPSVSVTNNSSAGAVCTTGSILLTSTSTPVASITSGTWNYTWSGPGTMTSTSTNAAVTGISSIGYNPVYNVSIFNSQDVYSVCGSAAATTIATITPVPTAITGASSICGGASSVYSGGATSGTPGWSITGTGSSYVSGVVTTGYNVTSTNPAAQQTITINYANGCGTATPKTVNINVQPVAITASDFVSAPINAICTVHSATFTDNTTGGTWSNTPTAEGTINSSTGVFTSTSTTGTTTISYVMTTGGCSVTTPLPVGNSGPTAITGGASSVCVGASITAFSSTPSGGAWSISPATAATISATAIVTGLANTNGTPAVITYNTGCGTAATATVTVNGTSGNIATPATVCAGASFSLNGSAVIPSSGTTYAWSGPNTFASTAMNPVVSSSVSIAANGTYTLTATKGGCSNKYTTIATVAPVPAVPSITPLASALCSGSSTSFTSSLTTQTAQAFAVPVYTPTFAVSGTLNSATSWTSGNSNDGYYSVLLPFNFSFFGNSYNTIYIGTNGYITFNAGSTLAPATAITAGTPGNVIALFQNDMTLAASGSIQYGVSGTTPNRKFVINYNAVPGAASGGPNSGYIVLNESTNVVDVIANTFTHNTSANATCGIAGATGTGGVAATGRNNASYNITTGEAWRFYSLNNYTYSWTPSATIISPNTSNPSTTALSVNTTYTLTVSDDISSGCTSSNTSAITVNNSAAASVTGPEACIGASSVNMAYSSVTGTPTTYTINWTSGALAANFTNATNITFPGGTSGNIPLTIGNLATPGSNYDGIITFNNASSCSNSYPFTVSITAQPSLSLASVTLTSPSATTMCLGQILDLAVTGASGGASPFVYTWQGPGISGTATTASGTLVYTASAASTGAYSVSLSSGSSGCITTPFKATSSAYTVLSNTIPTLGGLTASTPSLCASNTFTLTATGASGGNIYTWTGPNGYSATGTLGSVAFTPTTSVATGAYSVTLTSSVTACTSNVTPAVITSVTVNPAPAAGVITGTTTACAGATIALSETASGGTWISSAPAIASINTSGVVTAISTGSATISYVVTNSCGTAYATYTVTVSPLPFAGVISGTTTVCAGSATALTTTGSGGIWSSSNTGIATVNTSGVVAALSAGTSNISYTVINSCGTSIASVTATVNPLPVSGVISGTTAVCASSVTTMTTTGTGGTWSSSASGIASVNASGVVTGVSAGTSTISYAVTNSCGTAVATHSVTVNPLPFSGVISGTTTVCAGSSIALTITGSGGIWSSSNTGVGTVNTSGLVTALSAGTSNISYTVVNSCGTSIASVTATVNPLPFAGVISGTTTVCAGSSTTLTTTGSGGTWSSSNTGVATVSTSGLVTALSAGTSNISYTVINSCGTSIASVTATVNPLPVSGVISGTTTVCAGSSATLTTTGSGGTWSSSNTGVATINTSGMVTGLSAGTSHISYTVINSCGTSIASVTATVNPLPVSGVISGTTTVCAGYSATLTTTGSGGTWSSNNTGVATINISGMVTALSAGTSHISYTVVNSCGTSIASVTATVNPLPVSGVISGTITVCAGSSTTLTTTGSGGTWSSSNTGVATVNTSGFVTALSAGTSHISYTVINSCGTSIASVTATVNPLPVAGTISGSSTVCAASTSTLTTTGSGGTWSSSASGIASVNASGLGSGISAGAAIISYVVTNSCGTAVATHSVTVNPLPVAGSISGSLTVCAGLSTNLSASGSGGGTWSSSNTGVATVSTSGITQGIASGSANISYSVTNSCGTSVASASVTINAIPSPGSISGTTSLCVGTTTSLTNGASGGTWSSSATGIATVNSTGTVNGISAGIATISYAVTTACGAAATTATVTIANQGTWLGTADTNWNNSANWPCGIIPSSSVDVTIPSGTPYAPSIISGASVAKSLNIASGVTMTISSSASLDIKNNLTNNGVVTGTGVIIMSGVTAQKVMGKGMVYNLQLNNAAGLSVNSASDSLKIKGALVLTSGTLTTNNGLVLVSDNTGSGRISTITGGGISGNVTVQQYIQGDRRAYRFIGHPFSSSIALSQLAQYIDITGSLGSANGFTSTTSNAPSAYWYNTLAGNSAMGSDPGWTSFTSTNGSGANGFGQYEGIRLFLRGTKGQGLDGIPYSPSPVTISLYGSVNTGSLTVTMKKGSGANADYNLLSNPYPSPVNIGTVVYNAQTAGQITGGAYYVWNPYLSTGGQYETRPIDGSAYNLETNGAYEVRAASNGAVLHFAETNKAASINTILLKTTNEYLTLNVYDTTYHKWDGMYIKFNDAASEHEDALYDGRKPVSPASLNFYSWSADNTKLSLDARPYSEGKVIPLGIKSDYAQEFIIKADNVAMPSGGKVYLHDKYLSKYTLLTQGTEYRFAITTDNLSQGDKRFELGMGSEDVATIPAAATKIGFDVNMMPNPATDEVTISYATANKGNVVVRIMNAAGVTEIEQNLGAQQSGSTKIGLDKLASGIYIVELTSGNQKMVQRLVKE